MNTARSWYWLAGALVVGVLVVGAGWWTYANVLPRRLVRVADVKAEIALELQKGSTESDALAYLRRHGYESSGQVYPVMSGDAFLRAQGIELGTRALYGRIYPSRRDWFESTWINIWIVFDSAGHVDRTFVYEQGDAAGRIVQG